MSAQPPNVTPSPPPLPVIRDDGAPTSKESNTGRKFPCPGCGAKLDFDPSQRALACPYCRYSEEIAPDAQEVQERDWDEYWENANNQGATIVGRSSEVKCKACAAVVLLEDKVATDRCPYCGNDLDNQPVAAKDMILPEGILPFKIDLKKAKAAFNQWVGERWFAPSDLKQLADVGRFNGIYVPFWTYDSMTYTRYTGMRGDNYQEIETYVDHETYTESDGQGGTVTRTRPVTKTRTVTKIRWTPAAGNVDHFFDDILICGSHSIPDDLVRELGPWDLRNLEAFRDEFLAGFQTERYTIDLKEGFDSARGIMDGQIRVLCCRHIGGDHQQLSSVNTQHTAITFKHILQPVWLAPYRYRDKLYRIVVNARTGEVVGTRPYSFWKIFLVILLVLAAIVVIGVIAKGSGAFHGKRGGTSSGAFVAAQTMPENPTPQEKAVVDRTSETSPFSKRGSLGRSLISRIHPLTEQRPWNIELSARLRDVPTHPPCPPFLRGGVTPPRRQMA